MCLLGLTDTAGRFSGGVEVSVPWNVVRVLERQERMLAQALEFENQAAAPLAELEKQG